MSTNKNTKSKNRKAVFVVKSTAKFGEGMIDYSKVKIHDSKTKVTLICKICGYKWKPYQHNHLGKQGSGCPNCAGVAPLTTAQFVAMCIEVHADLYDYSNTKYKGLKHKITIKCNRCGKLATPTAGNHLYRGNGCCNISKGENHIEILLSKAGINFTHNKTLPFSEGLKYDFIIEDLKLIIECDSSYHWQDNHFFKTTAEEQLQKDIYKQNIAEYNGYKVIRLIYTNRDSLTQEFYTKFYNVYFV